MRRTALVASGLVGGGVAAAGVAAVALVADRHTAFTLGGALLAGGAAGAALGAWWERTREALLEFARSLAVDRAARLTADRTADPALAAAFNDMATAIERRVRGVEAELDRLAAVLATMTEGVVGLDPTGRIVLLNDAMRALLPVQEPVGRPWVEVVRHHDLNEMIGRVLREGDRLAGEVTFESPAPARTFTVQASVVPGGEHADKELRAIFVFHDVTELKRLGRARTDFVANVAHELRTPLTSVSGYLEALLDGAKDDSVQRDDFLRVMKRHADRLNALVGDLLQLSQIESGVYRWRRDPVDLVALSRRSVALIAPVAAKKNVAVVCRSLEPTSVLLGDGEKLTQVLLNLLDNAVKYTPDGGSVEVEVGRDEESFVLQVTDTGVGIPASDLQRIFERFYRVDRARSRDLGGTGLGLSIVKHIVEAHRGRVTVTSRVGKGSTFTVRLPRVEESAPLDEPVPAHAGNFTGG
jgi:two-component system phosphate regulon sensor histidine kinase PhoR